MKIRIKGNSLRYRLTRTGVERLAMDGYLEESTDFGPSTLAYSLQKVLVGSLSASFKNNVITTYVSKFAAFFWLNAIICMANFRGNVQKNNDKSRVDYKLRNSFL